MMRMQAFMAQMCDHVPILSNFALGTCSRNRTGATCQYFAVHMFGLRICLLKIEDSLKKPSLTFYTSVDPIGKK